MAGVEDLQGGWRMSGLHDSPRADDAQLTPCSKGSGAAKALLTLLIPLNAANLARLAYIATPLPLGYVARPASKVARHLL
jgi:hypothetical protein